MAFYCAALEWLPYVTALQCVHCHWVSVVDIVDDKSMSGATRGAGVASVFRSEGSLQLVGHTCFVKRSHRLHESTLYTVLKSHSFNLV